MREIIKTNLKQTYNFVQKPEQANDMIKTSTQDYKNYQSI